MFITSVVYGTCHCMSYEKVGWSLPSESRQRDMFLFIFKGLVAKLPFYITSVLGWCSRPYQTQCTDWQSLQVWTELGKTTSSFYASSIRTSFKSTLIYVCHYKPFSLFRHTFSFINLVFLIIISFFHICIFICIFLAMKSFLLLTNHFR